MLDDPQQSADYKAWSVTWRWDMAMEEPWKPGNFRLVNQDSCGHYGGLSVAGAKTIEQWEQKPGSYITVSHWQVAGSNGENLLAMKACDSDNWP